MALYEGLDVTYHITSGNGYRCCGLTQLSGFSGICYELGEDSFWEEKLKRIGAKYCYNSPGEGNFTFAISAERVIKASKGTIYYYLTRHPKCRVIHYYKNNAHGPNVVMMFMLHLYPDAVEVAVNNNLTEVLKNIYKDSYGQWHIKEPT